eukprot:4543909-Pleurochrysis_carterae.AAC.1
MDVASMFLPTADDDAEANEMGDVDDSALIHGRLSSADVYMLGPVTSDRTHAVLKRGNEKRAAEKAEKDARANERKRKRAAAKAEARGPR